MRNREWFVGFVLPVVVLAAALTAGAPPAAAAVTPSVPAGLAVPLPPGDDDPAETRRYIVTVRPDADPAEVAAMVEGVRPLYVFRSTINGFAARLTPEQRDALAALREVEAVEEDGVAGVPT
ncbi:protease inhibitor I9 family protein [Streptomyces sp. NBC_01551]|uniref:protease inhibitor I9 family protein n=1 Tax=Streptomyces sp. NBC_01551 TaxID=2975876 RepID=UPI00225450F2|nr:protease inhibitor I9 family protein [Streptomyces sp. NBC_01551]MCX4526929.1 protease inhibitor I9 family protein [Streptomyces sp. NBC_01551]